MYDSSTRDLQWWNIENDYTVKDNSCSAYYRYDLKNDYSLLIHCVSIDLEDYVWTESVHKYARRGNKQT